MLRQTPKIVRLRLLSLPMRSMWNEPATLRATLQLTVLRPPGPVAAHSPCRSCGGGDAGRSLLPSSPAGHDVDARRAGSVICVIVSVSGRRVSPGHGSAGAG